MNLSVELSARDEVPTWLAYGTPVFTVVGALALSAVALVALSVDPVAAYNTMFVETLTDPFGLRQTATRTVPLVLTGSLCTSPARGSVERRRRGAAVRRRRRRDVARAERLPAAGRADPARAAGRRRRRGLWAGIPGYLRAKWDVNEIITTLLLTFVATQFASYLVRGPMQGGSGNFPGSALLPDAAQFPAIPVLDVHAGFLVGLLAVAVTAIVVGRTRVGFDITFVGSNPLAAAQAGMSTFRVYLFVFLVGGAFAGLAGFSEISGVQERLMPEFSAGYGFTAIPIALLGRNGAARVLLAAAFFALLFVGGSKLEVSYGVPAALVDVIQALVILFLITAEFVKRYSVDVEIEREPAPAGGAGEA
ncbi:ABC transporter permease [Halosimplex aquaticum]